MSQLLDQIHGRHSPQQLQIAVPFQDQLELVDFSMHHYFTECYFERWLWRDLWRRVCIWDHNWEYWTFNHRHRGKGLLRPVLLVLKESAGAGGFVHDEDGQGWDRVNGQWHWLIHLCRIGYLWQTEVQDNQDLRSKALGIHLRQYWWVCLLRYDLLLRVHKLRLE